MVLSVVDSTMLNWLVFNSMSGTWESFSRADLIVSFFGGAGFAAVLVVMVAALSKVDTNEKQIKSSRSSLEPDERVLGDK